MTYDSPCMSYMALYIISLHIVNSNSRSSNHHWKLNHADGKVVQANDETGDLEDEDLMNIISNKVMSDGHWKVETVTYRKSDCKSRSNIHSFEHRKNMVSSKKPKKVLSCGKPVNKTDYDHLRGVADRFEHPHIPEPEVALIFRKKGSKTSEIDLNDLEQKLFKAKKEKPNSSHVYNQIGNFWRIKGNTQLSIECFRKALTLSSQDSDILLNLARVLFNLKYLDDAETLTRTSLQMQKPNQNPWLHHFNLGEILKTRGHFQEAAMHFHQSLELNPGFQPAQANIREMEIETAPNSFITQYTFFIILFLVLGVLVGVIMSIEANFEGNSETTKNPRHFSRAMAMRSIKLRIDPSRFMRLRKLNC